MTPPIAKKIPVELELHGDKRLDPYYWLKDRDNPEVLSYVQEENNYFKSQTAHNENFREVLFKEMKSRIKEDDSSLPYKLNGYWYVTRFEKDLEYPIYSRKKEVLSAKEELLFECNELSKGYDFFNLKGVSVSPDNRYAAFGIDTNGRRQYTIQIKNLETSEILPDVLINTTGAAMWANDNKTLFYTSKDPITLRSDKIYKHILGTPSEDDQLVFHEKDETFNTFVYKTKSRKYIVIGSNSTLTTEFQILDANHPEEEFSLFSKRIKGVEYSIYHYDKDFFILTNKDDAVNFKLMKVSEEATSIEHWKEFILHRPEVLLEDVDIFKDYYVLSERVNGLSKIRVCRWDGSEDYYLPFKSETYIAYPFVNPDFDTETLRYVYNSMTSPYAILDYNFKTRKAEVKKEQEVLGEDFNKDNYTSKRLWAPAIDGKEIPISLVYHKNTKIDGSAPLLLYGYGAYGSTSDPYFSTTRLSLLDRGFIFAIAHIRGGEYLGRPWYDAGKLLNKKNSFMDFINCSQFLINNNYTNKSHLYAYGGSAGGLLVGAVLNMAPELYNGVIAAVPFVDVITTMLDTSIPLTTGEYDEWGDPNKKVYYNYIKSYSPYDNVITQEYPNILVTSGWYDSQVQYWEPTKWVAKLRAHKRDNNKLFLYTNLEAGHGGASGRFEALKETAIEYAFLLELEGKASK